MVERNRDRALFRGECEDSWVRCRNFSFTIFLNLVERATNVHRLVTTKPSPRRSQQKRKQIAEREQSTWFKILNPKYSQGKDAKNCLSGTGTVNLLPAGI